jgi:phosphoribosylglycinamide formyltransferase 1
MQALIKAARAPDYPARIVGVISNRPEAAGLAIARKYGIATAIHQLKSYPDKIAADCAITSTLESWGVDYVCLAGFMRILDDKFVRHWMGRLINIHPSLLPKFKGLNTHQRAIEAGETRHGCSVHFVVPELDAGPVFVQTEVPVLPNDTPEILAERVLGVEHRTYRVALRKLALGRVKLENGDVVQGSG